MSRAQKQPLPGKMAVLLDDSGPASAGGRYLLAW